MKFKKLLIVASILVTVAVPLLTTGSAKAASGKCFFNAAGPVISGGNCSVPGRYGAYGTNDVLTGRDGSGNGSAIPASVNTKQEFINYIRNRFNSGNVHDQVGAAFIIQEMRSKTDQSWPSNADVNDWENLVNLSSVRVTRGWDGSVGRTSYYDPGKRNTFYAGHPTVGREVIFVRQNGNLLAEIETACGNMVAGPGVITAPSWTLDATSTSNRVKAKVGATVTFRHVIQDTGPDDMDADLQGYVEWWNSSGPGAPDGKKVRDCNDGNGLEAAPGIDSKKICTDDFVIPASANVGDVYCQRVQYRPKTRGQTEWRHSQRACVEVSDTTVGVDSLDCSAFVTSNPSPRPGTSFTVTMAVGGGTPTPTYTLSYVITDPAGGAVSGSQNGIITTTQTINGAQPGTYRFNWSFRNGDPLNTVTDCTGAVTVTREPYFEVLNGDANAAAGLTSASCVPSGGISGFNTAGSGSHTTIAAFAATAIAEFTSAGTTGKTLSFGNTTGTYGGGFAQTYCIPDDWSGRVPDPDPSVVGQTGIVDQITKFVNGDMYILGNVEYTSGSFSINNVPMRRFIATGNIYILGTVTRLDGIYEAQGKIYTCAIGAAAPLVAATTAEMISQCGQQLVVNGAFVAGGGIKLQRTFDSVGGGGQPAERFVYSPEVWVQAIKPGDPTTILDASGYDSITSLPPVL